MSLAKTAAKQPAAPPKKAAAKPAPAVSPGVEHVAFEMMQPRAAASSEETDANAAAADAVENTVAEASPYGIIIEDGLPAGEGQIHRVAFMDRLFPKIESAADEILKQANRVAKDCPYLSFWLNYYRGQSASRLERAIAHYALPQNKTLEGIEQAILDHVRKAVQAWVDHQVVELPEEIDWRIAEDHVDDAPSEAAAVQRMGADGQGSPGAPGSAAAIRGRLLTGAPLDSSVRTRMERGFGTSFSGVRIHTDSSAASTAQAYQARAFAIGQDVAFGAGQYRPGTMSGDLLLAHELAHTIQQRGAIAEGSAAQAYEADATRAALGAMLPETGLNATPQIGGGLGLRRCGTGEEPAPPTVDDKTYEDTIAELKALYVRKQAVEDGKAPNTELPEINKRIYDVAQRIRSWGVQLSDRQLKRAVEAGEDLRDKVGKPMSLEPEDMEAIGYKLVAAPGETVVGRTYELGITGPRYTEQDLSTSTTYAAKGWYVQKPGESALHGLQGWTGRNHSWTLDAVGTWRFGAVVRLGKNDAAGLVTKTITVEQPDKVAENRLAKRAEDNKKNNIGNTTLPSYLSQMAAQDLQNIKVGIADQNFGGSYIALSGSNPMMSYQNFMDVPNNQYTIHPAQGIKATRYQWMAVPDDFSAYPSQNYHGHSMRQIGGRAGFDLGTGDTALWLPLTPGVVTIYCTIFDVGGVAGEAKYRQVVLTDAEVSQVEKFRKYMKEAKEYLRRIREEGAFYAPAFHIAKETGIATELSLFVGRSSSDSDIKIIDVTPGAPRRDYGGSDFQAALNDFNKGNSYPVGTIRVDIPQNTLGIQATGWKIETSGASISQRLSSGWGWASLGMAVLGVAAMIVPGAQGLAPVFFFAAAGLGAASAGASLYQRSLEADPSGLGIAIDIASLAGSLLGMAGAANILKNGARVAAVNRVGQFVLYAGFTTDAIAGVFMAVEGAQQIAEILEAPGTAESKSSAITRILAGLLLNGGMLAWGAKDMKASSSKLQAAIGANGASVVGALPPSEIHMLGALEAPAMARLSGASLDDVKGVSALMREDPARAIALADRYGEKFVAGALVRPASLEDLAQALHAGAGEAAGTRGAYGPLVPGKARPAYLEQETPAGKFGPSSPSGLADRIQQVFMKPASAVKIELLEGATLRVPAKKTPAPTTPAPTTSAPKTPAPATTNYELVIPASGSRPEMVIPVTIKSTDVRPTSVHGAETGPARMEVRTTTDATGAIKYEANIEVHENLAKSDVGFAVGHELDELTLIATSGITGSDITKQKHASLLKTRAAGAGTPPPITAHDTAQARDFKNFVDQQVPLAKRSADFAMHEDVLTRALSMGFGGTANLEEKLALLAKMHVDDDMIKRLRVLAIGNDIKVKLPVNSPFASPGVIGHLIHAEKGSTASPVGGLHLESALAAHQADLVAKNQPLHLLKTADSPRTVGGATYNAYEQWQWTGTGPPTTRPSTPGGAAGATFGGWTLAADPKTTFGNLSGFLTEADAAYNTWRAANPMKAGNVDWSAAGPSGQMIGGWVDLTGPSAVQRTVYPLRVGKLASW